MGITHNIPRVIKAMPNGMAKIIALGKRGEYYLAFDETIYYKSDLSAAFDTAYIEGVVAYDPIKKDFAYTHHEGANFWRVAGFLVEVKKNKIVCFATLGETDLVQKYPKPETMREFASIVANFIFIVGNYARKNFYINLPF